MRKTEERRKNNNRGFTLIELIITVAIIAIFSGVILTFIGTGSSTYRSTSNSAKAQMEAQETADSLEDLIIDANYSIDYRSDSGGAITNDIDGDSGTGDKVLIICNKSNSGDTGSGDSTSAGCIYDILYWNRTEQKIYYSQNKTGSVSSGTSGSVLAEGITDFQADVSKAASDKIVRFQLGIKRGTKEIKTLHSVTLRNTVKIQ